MLDKLSGSVTIFFETAPSSSGLGRWPLKPETGIQIPLGPQTPSPIGEGVFSCFVGPPLHQDQLPTVYYSRGTQSAHYFGFTHRILILAWYATAYGDYFVLGSELAFIEPLDDADRCMQISMIDYYLHG
jgi:hypothetical protein